MRLNPAAFDRHLAHMGQRLMWRRSYACACINPESGQPDPRHALCSGKGRLWDAGIETVVGVPSQSTALKWGAPGMWLDGDMALSIPQDSPMWDAGAFDRVLMLNSNDVFSQAMKRGSPTERLLFTPASFSRVFWLHPTTRLPIDGALPVVDLLGNLSWPNGGGPPAGMTYSLTGQRFDEYFVFASLPSDRNQHSGARLPKRAQLRQWDLFGR